MDRKIYFLSITKRNVTYILLRFLFASIHGAYAVRENSRSEAKIHAALPQFLERTQYARFLFLRFCHRMIEYNMLDAPDAAQAVFFGRIALTCEQVYRICRTEAEAEFVFVVTVNFKRRASDRGLIVPFGCVYGFCIRDMDDSVNTLRLFGHNPAISNLAGYLTSMNFGEVPTCAVVCIEFSFNHWKDIHKNTGTLKFFDYPKKQ